MQATTTTTAVLTTASTAAASASSPAGTSRSSSPSALASPSSVTSKGNKTAVALRTPAPRSESLAYPKANTSTMLSKVQYCLRQNTKTSLAVAAVLVVVVVVASDLVARGNVGGVVSRSSYGGLRGFGSAPSMIDNWGAAAHRGYFSVEDSKLGNGKYRFAAVTDLDELSRVTTESKPTFRSVFMSGQLTKNEETGRYKLQLDEDDSPNPDHKPRTLLTKHNEAGRGAEFSELTVYGHRLLTFDDRTGDVFEILNTPDGKDSFVVPRFVITEGEGDTDKGMKWEWSTVKDGELYLGSMGKEYTRPDGSIKNTNNLWIVVVNGRGEMRRVDWTEQYGVVRKALNAAAPGYLIIEAVNWSDKLQKWVFLPRRISSEKYDEVKDEKMGGTKAVLVDKDFKTAEVVDLKMSVDPYKGFSTFAFVPDSGDKHALAIRSVEENCVGFDETVCSQRSYFLVLDVTTGQVLSNEVKTAVDIKFEGVEFVDMYKVPEL